MPTQNTPQSQGVWEIPLGISLNVYTCARARSIITGNLCLVHCQHVADGQELPARLGVSNTPESTAKVLGDSQRQLCRKGVVQISRWFLVMIFSSDFPYCHCSHSLVKEHLYPPLMSELQVREDNFEDKYLCLISVLHSPSFHTHTWLRGPFLWGFEVSLSCCEWQGMEDGDGMKEWTTTGMMVYKLYNSTNLLDFILTLT